jgi:mannose/fructose-specific phosphotransferase system component IIA
VNVLLISHGNLASGMLSAAEIILGKQKDVFSINMYMDNQTLKYKVDSIMKKFEDPKLNLLVITDIFGGSVNQKVLQIFNLDTTYIITGMNLPLILEILLKKNELNFDYINEIIEENKKQIIFINNQLKNDTVTDDF